MKYITAIGGKEYLVEILDEHHISLDGKTYTVDFQAVGDQPIFSMLLDGHSYEAFVYPSDEGWQVLMHGTLYPATVEDERERRLRAAAGRVVVERGEYLLKAPMPGLVFSIPVAEGQKVTRGEVLVILESMKMQNELKAPRDGTVARLRVQEGDSVEQRQTLLSLL